MEDYKFEYVKIQDYVDISKFSEYNTLVSLLWELEEEHTASMMKKIPGSKIGASLYNPEHGLQRGFELLVIAAYLKFTDQLKWEGLVGEYNACEALGLRNLMGCKVNDCPKMADPSRNLFDRYLELYVPIFETYNALMEGDETLECEPGHISEVVVRSFKTPDELLEVMEGIQGALEDVTKIIASELRSDSKGIWQWVLNSAKVVVIESIPKWMGNASKKDAEGWYL